MRNFLLSFFSVCACHLLSGQDPSNDLHFTQLATRWDEAIPLGNATLGALVWMKGDHLRFSLDRADVWDLRPMKGLHRKEFSYKWVQKQVAKKDYQIVQTYFDAPYETQPAPSKIPAGALEFNLPNSKVKAVRLQVSTATCEVSWENGMTMKTFVHATKPVGWFRFENVSTSIEPMIVPPPYEGKPTNGLTNSVEGDDLSRLGYHQGEVVQRYHGITYTQEGWGGFVYEISVDWKQIDNKIIEGVWSISSHYKGKKITPKSSETTKEALPLGYSNENLSHLLWWKNFWSKSSITLPDSLLERQWYLDQYKFGCTSRRGAPPISLQGIWTADNGRIPPWKGDFHHDLNTQLSYWPAYSSNHLEEALAYIDHLEENKSNYERYTKMYFGLNGLAVPGVTTLDGTEMGGWIQYSLSPTVAAWLAHHYYMQWRYSMDEEFLKNKAYPWIKQVAIFVQSATALDAKGHRQLPISSSPEINDNDISAWFRQNTNYDLALMKFVFKVAAELALQLGNRDESERWKKVGSEFGEFALTEKDELMISPTLRYQQSHRHFSNAMAIHPLGLIRYDDGEKNRSIIENTIHLLDSVGSDYWCGYSYAWLGNLKARAKDGEGAAKALTFFAKAFCLPNSFHVNGDQTKSGFSKFTYRPFTLEGNFAFAAGIQEMLLQSHSGFIDIMPAVPSTWNKVSFKQLRVEGAFLVDAERSSGKLQEVKIVSEKGGETELKISMDEWEVVLKEDASIQNSRDGFVNLSFEPGGYIFLKHKN